MGRGSLGARLGVCLAALCFCSFGAFGSLGCQALYGGKPEKLPSVPRKKAPPEAAVVEVQIKEIDECKADFQADPKAVRPQAELSNRLTGEGDNAISSSDKATEPAAQAGLLKEGIDKYRNALLKDPYNPEATLKLARAYDRVYRKGCAIAMLKRLAKLAENPKFGKTATREIDSIADNDQWFKRYRKDAVAAVGR